MTVLSAESTISAGSRPFECVLSLHDDLQIPEGFGGLENKPLVCSSRLPSSSATDTVATSSATSQHGSSTVTTAAGATPRSGKSHLWTSKKTLIPVRRDPTRRLTPVRSPGARLFSLSTVIDLGSRKLAGLGDGQEHAHRACRRSAKGHLARTRLAARYGLPPGPRVGQMSEPLTVACIPQQVSLSGGSFARVTWLVFKG